MYVQVLQRPNNSLVDKLVQSKLVSEDIVGYEVINAMLTMTSTLLGTSSRTLLLQPHRVAKHISSKLRLNL